MPGQVRVRAIQPAPVGVGLPGPVGGRTARLDRDLAGPELAAFATRLARDPDRWRHLVRHDDDARVYELIWADDHVNAWVICWSAGQDTGFHDHGRSAGGIHVVDGTICEERLALWRPSVDRAFTPGSSFHVPPSAIHRVFHGGTRPAVSVHAYSPPLTQMGDYRFGPDGQLEREARDCALPSRTASFTVPEGAQQSA
ncbi:MAG TPA: cysteine dioxygenase family protein [Solirubrobacteraceae bacterium]|jgi:hypothetical protein|nr:cysteine dioxygenase family protein [Solirubrobacteraceae bacterium]